jgi:hypothetical protein
MDFFWFYVRDGKQQGPVPDADIAGLVASGQLRPTDLVWREGLGDWMPAAQAPGLTWTSGLPVQGVPPAIRTVLPSVGQAAGGKILENKSVNPLVALAASFFCLPLGAIVLGQTRKGLMITLATMIGCCLCILPGILVSWMGIFDSYVTAQALADGKPVGENEYTVEALYKIVKILDKTAYFRG